MKIFLSSLEGNRKVVDELLKRDIKLKWNLMSYYAIGKGKKARETAQIIRDNSEGIMIDSGAHSFQRGVGGKSEWEAYTKEYAEFIKEFDRPNVVGFFEMDIDNIVGYEEVLRLRSILEEVTPKIIPVWHRNRGIDDFKKMCEKYSGKIIAISGIRGEITDNQFLMFIKYAKAHNCKVHCLGMTRRNIMKKVPFDFTDSSTWLQQVNFGNTYVSGGRFPKAKGEEKTRQYVFNYLEGIKLQEQFYEKWKKVCKD